MLLLGVARGVESPRFGICNNTCEGIRKLGRFRIRGLWIIQTRILDQCLKLVVQRDSLRRRSIAMASLLRALTFSFRGLVTIAKVGRILEIQLLGQDENCLRQNLAYKAHKYRTP